MGPHRCFLRDRSKEVSETLRVRKSSEFSLALKVPTSFLKHLLTLLIFILSIESETLFSQTLPSGSQVASNNSASKPESEVIADNIRQEVEAFVLVFNKRDAKGVASLWTKDGEYIDESGQAFCRA